MSKDVLDLNLECILKIQEFLNAESVCSLAASSSSLRTKLLDAFKAHPSQRAHASLHVSFVTVNMFQVKLDGRKFVFKMAAPSAEKHHRRGSKKVYVCEDPATRMLEFIGSIVKCPYLDFHHVEVHVIGYHASFLGTKMTEMKNVVDQGVAGRYPVVFGLKEIRKHLLPSLKAHVESNLPPITDWRWEVVQKDLMSVFGEAITPHLCKDGNHNLLSNEGLEDVPIQYRLPYLECKAVKLLPEVIVALFSGHKTEFLDETS